MRILTQKDGSSVIKGALGEEGADMTTLIADIEQIDIYGSGNRLMNRLTS